MIEITDTSVMFICATVVVCFYLWVMHKEVP